MRTTSELRSQPVRNAASPSADFHVNRYAAYRGDDMTTDADLAAFPDEERVSAYAREALAWAVDRGLINGVAQGGESWLEPQAGATRAQVATILMRFLKQK